MISSQDSWLNIISNIQVVLMNIQIIQVFNDIKSFIISNIQGQKKTTFPNDFQKELIQYLCDVPGGWPFSSWRFKGFWIPCGEKLSGWWLNQPI